MSTRSTNPSQENKCAHPACNCPVESGKQYCSISCEDSVKSGAGNDIACGCDHRQCQLAA
jgi:hypothetical protein